MLSDQQMQEIKNLSNTQNMFVEPKTSRNIDQVAISYDLNKEMLRFEDMINSNNFNCFELHRVSKNNSLYFMLQYMYKKYNFQDELRMDSSKFQKFSLKL